MKKKVGVWGRILAVSTFNRIQQSAGLLEENNKLDDANISKQVNLLKSQMKGKPLLHEIRVMSSSFFTIITGHTHRL